MNKNKGFTLIELLAVIVIMAIIALIATPLIMKVIEDSRKNSSKDSVYGYIEAAEVSISTELMSNPDINYNGEYEISSNKLVGTKDELSVNSKGTKVDGTVYIESNIIKRATLSTGGYDLTYYDSKAYVLGKSTNNPTTYVDGTAVYFNPETGEKCEESEAVSTHGTKSGCMKWYTFGDKEGNTTLKLLLDHNIADSAWISKEDYINAGGTEEEYGTLGNNNIGPITAINTLRNDTITWQAGLNSRLITANEIARITGNDIANNWDSSISTNWFYLGTNNQVQDLTANNKYAWVFDRLSGCISNGGCNIEDNNASVAYWTNDIRTGSSSHAWYVTSYGPLHYRQPINNLGIRPVITVSKSALK